MNYAFGVTIGSSLDCQDLGPGKKFDHSCVVDLRRCVNNGPQPVEESLLRKLANYRVAYEQMPISMYSANARQKNDLFRTISEHGSNVFILCDEMVAVARFCQELDIPFSSKDLFLVETANDYIPVQVSPRPVQTSSFGSLAS